MGEIYGYKPCEEAPGPDHTTKCVPCPQCVGTHYSDGELCPLCEGNGHVLPVRVATISPRAPARQTFP